jgi:hypothetical protein
MNAIRRSAFVTIALLALLLQPRVARGDDRAEYIRGRSNGVTPGEVVLWVPRVAFFPMYVVTEYGLRRPLVAVVGWGERHYVVPWARRVFHPTPDFRWAPIVHYQVGFLPSAGARIWWDNALAPRNQIVLSGATGGADVIELYGTDRVQLGTVQLGVRGDYFHRADQIFIGLGPRTELANLTRYTRTRRAVLGTFSWMPSHHSEGSLAAGYSSEDTERGIAPSIDSLLQTQGAPPGFGSLSLLVARGEAIFDSRHDPEEFSGVRLDVRGTLAADTRNSERSFVAADALLEGALEVMRPGRVVVASLYAAETAHFGSEEVSFTYLPTLGRRIHHGFGAGRFIGEAALVAGLAYRYPLLAHLDAVWDASVGNVFARDFSDFRPGLLTGSLGLGVRTRSAHESEFEALLAFGTGRFEKGFGLDSVQLYLGINRGL